MLIEKIVGSLIVLWILLDQFFVTRVLLDPPFWVNVGAILGSVVASYTPVSSVGGSSDCVPGVMVGVGGNI